MMILGCCIAPLDDSAGTDRGSVWFYNWNKTTSTWDTVNLVYDGGSTDTRLQLGVVGGEARLGWSMEMSNDGTHLIISAPFSDSDDNVGFIQILEYFAADTSEYNQEGWHFKYRWNNRDDLSYYSNDPNTGVGQYLLIMMEDLLLLVDVVMQLKPIKEQFLYMSGMMIRHMYN